ncbi:glycosyltransferase family 29 protein [Ensifer soli]|uniref:glycosyltransferase family 29 protein n=1 Tax=Ciceribacter sp. sgz301302 TaxID=3342379 RepID=UPI0035B8B1FB
MTTTFPPTIEFEDLVGEFRSIAIVGNSPKLLESDHGSLIDGHDVVVRINDGRTDKYERQAGSKTTVRFVGIPIKDRYRAFFAALKEDSTIVTRTANAPILAELGWTGETKYIDDYGWIMRHAFRRLTKLIPLDNIPQKNPRTGILILSMLVNAMLSGKTISLFGFEIAERKGGAEHFYNDGRKFDETLHNWNDFHCPMTYEFDAILKLVERSLIKVN